MNTKLGLLIEYTRVIERVGAFNLTFLRLPMMVFSMAVVAHGRFEWGKGVWGIALGGSATVCGGLSRILVELNRKAGIRP